MGPSAFRAGIERSWHNLRMMSNRCETCGLELEFRREGSVQGGFCTRCGWRFVTTYLPAIHSDPALYQVHACGGDHRNASHISAVSGMIGDNFLVARKLLQQHEPVVFKGRAPDVRRVRDVLAAAGLGCRIEPPFPHSDSE